MIHFLYILFFVLFAQGLSPDTIESYLRANLIDFDSFEYRVVSQDIGKDENISIDYSRTFLRKNKYGYIPIILKGKLGKRKSLLTVRLKLLKKVAVANHTIRRGETISKDDFVLKTKDVTGLRFPPITTLDGKVNFKARVNIRDGEILTDNMIEKGETIFVGNRVNAIYESGVVVVSFPAEARSSGRIGDLIRVKRNDGIIFKGKVINNKEVKIIE